MHACVHTYISVMFGNMGNCSPSNLNWLLDRLNHSNAISPVSSINGNVCNKFSCINSHWSDVRPLKMPDGMVSSRFRRKNSCSKCCCVRNRRAGNADMLFSPKSLRKWHTTIQKLINQRIKCNYFVSKGRNGSVTHAGRRLFLFSSGRTTHDVNAMEWKQKWKVIIISTSVGRIAQDNLQ